jgi:hypothetical protein
MEFDQTVRYIVNQHKSLTTIYFFNELHRRKINVKKVINKLNEVYGEHYSGEQLLIFGEKYLNDYLMNKHGLDFNQFLLAAFEPIYHRFKHLS